MTGESDEDRFQRGLELQTAGRFAEAAAIYRPLAERVLTLKLAVNLGSCLAELGDRSGAVRYLSLAAGHAHTNGVIRRLLGFALGEAGQVDEAERALREALALMPGDLQTELALGGLLLSAGRYAEGWPLLRRRGEAHPGVVPAMPVDFPEWTGQPLAGKSILVWVEQGFGDKIQMARFMAKLKARGAARVTLGCSPALTHLFSTLSGVDRLVEVSTGQSLTIDRHDYWSRYFSLPDYLGVTLESLTAAPYLAAPADRRAAWARFRPDVRGPRIGLVSQASPTGFNAANKGLKPEDARRLLDLGAISLHPEDTGAADFADTAAMLETLDLVVSIDTSVAHLAGAMGKPCWTLLPYNKCDWRWLRGRADSPWYPSLRLYRAERAFDWTSTLDRVIADLSAGGFMR